MTAGMDVRRYLYHLVRSEQIEDARNKLDWYPML